MDKQNILNNGILSSYKEEQFPYSAHAPQIGITIKSCRGVNDLDEKSSLAFRPGEEKCSVTSFPEES